MKNDQPKNYFKYKLSPEYQEKCRKKITNEEVKELFIRKENGDPKVRDELIIVNLGLVIYTASKFKTQYYNYEDIISVGIVGLIKAIDTFSLDKKINFATYASKCITNEILMFMRKNKKYNFDVSYSAIIAIDQSDGNEMHLEEILKDEKNNIDECVERTFYEKELEKTLNIILNYCSQKYKRCILYYMAGYKQSEIEKILNLSQSYVCRIRQIVKKEVNRNRFKLAHDKSRMYYVKIQNSMIWICVNKAKDYDISEIYEIFIKDIFIKKTTNIQYNKENLIIEMPLLQESFEILAELIYWIE